MQGLTLGFFSRQVTNIFNLLNSKTDVPKMGKIKCHSFDIFCNYSTDNTIKSNYSSVILI